MSDGQLFGDDPPFVVGTKRELELLRTSSTLAAVDYTADVGYSPALFTQVSLPYQNPPANLELWTRRNGDVSLQVAPRLVQDADGTVQRLFPYGVTPRHLITFLSTEAKRTDSRTIELGGSLTAFMRKLDLAHTGKSARMLRDQMHRFFGSRITFEGKTSNLSGEGSQTVYFQFASKMTLWDSAPRLEGDIVPKALWENEVILSEDFYNEIMSRPVPLDLNIIRALKYPMSIDIYEWATHKMYSLKSDTYIRYEDLAAQFGSQFAETRNFKRQFLLRLADVVKLYPELRVEHSDNGKGMGTLKLSPSRTSIPRINPRAKTEFKAVGA